MSNSVSPDTAKTLPAANPGVSASVSASAGTGKTWLLVTRLIRLLLSGTRPDGILAITFTRKAAAEMTTRLNARLLDLAQCSKQNLITRLTEMDADTDEATIQQARSLYETLLSNPRNIRTTTFHSFCQDILHRFPLEADIAPGFELLEVISEEQKIAWNNLCADASNNPDGELSKAMENLLDACGGLENTIKALNNFLDHRSDWWAFTETQSDNKEKQHQFAIDTLSSKLNVSLNDEPELEFFSPSILNLLKEFVQLLQKHQNKKNNQYLDALSIARDTTGNISDRFESLKKAFLTQKGQPLMRKENKAQAKSMGEIGQLRFIEIHNLVCTAIEITQKILNDQKSLRRNSAWYNTGIHLLNHFQQIKAEQRLLDFSDLEWRAYLLLNKSNNVHWIQYKLDQRIDHLLVDEFQDTNPTQWRLILPLLQELAAGEDERGRSVFLVGDKKQSIYGFRRADPDLFEAAQTWLKTNLQAVSQPLDVSWRSADAIMQFVNRIFGEEPLKQVLGHFSKHTTHFPDLWGRVELIPLVELDEETEDEIQFESDLNQASDSSNLILRNPLQEPRLLALDQRYLEEGRLIAERIKHLVDNETLLGDVEKAHPVQYSDIIILLRNRTHSTYYEQALREKRIPYIGASRGTLLESQEAQDLINLLEILIAPFNNLALASLLRSPIFNCSHDDLITLSKRKETSWMQRLSTYVSNDFSTDTSNNSLTRAHVLLSKWQKLAGKLPVHDLLDHIYNEGDVMNRYHAAYPPHLQHRVKANLTSFIELALELDSGRYPTIGRFVSRLKLLRQQDKDAPDEGSPVHTDSHVRIMTIHASKGLEAPVIFLADAANTGQNKIAYKAIVDWPAQAERPDSFIIAGKKHNLDDFTESILEKNAISETRENINLLYVAVTRARQLLFISGCRPKNGINLGWYGLIMDMYYETTNKNSVLVETGKYPELSMALPNNDKPFTKVDPRLNQVLPGRERETIIAPSYQTETINKLSTEHEQDDGRLRGLFIHRCLQLLCESGANNINKSALNDTALLTRISSDLGIFLLKKNNGSSLQRILQEKLMGWLTEAKTVFKNKEFSQFFDKDKYLSAFNEVPVQYMQTNNKKEQMVYGIIDRVIVTDKEVFVLDYKTHRLALDDKTDELEKYYSPQIELYCKGAGKIWPGKIINGYLLLTHTSQLITVHSEQ